MLYPILLLLTNVFSVTCSNFEITLQNERQAAQMQMQKKIGTGGLNPADTGIFRYAKYLQVPGSGKGPGPSLV